jgi:probable phosphoglycerate mutase
MVFRNTFLLLRHGHSLANERGLIISSPEVGLHQFGLSESGREQIVGCVERDRGRLRSVSRIYSSDYLRTMETTRIVADRLGVRFESSPLLRERFFGVWDGKSNSHYETVWKNDLIDPGNSIGNVESVQAVADRMSKLVRSLDDEASDQTFLLVSHGDPLQIMMAVARGIDLRFHRSQRPIETGQLRVLNEAEGCDGDSDRATR